jgi:YVTN family beta-propeller protein
VLAFTPAAAKDTGLIFVSNEKTNNIIVIDPKTYKVVKDIKVSRRPRDMHFDADHSKLYVACGDDDVIDILDVATLKITGKLGPGRARKRSPWTRNGGASTSPTKKARRLPSSTWIGTRSSRK